MVGLGLNELGKEYVVVEMFGGQCFKIILVKMFLENLDVIFLDELINYLDIVYIEWLIEYLNDFVGVVMIIFYDYDFLEWVINMIVDVFFGKIIKYWGSFKQVMC